jgi:hypothetical protein
MWRELSKTIDVSLYSFEFGFVTWFSKHKLYKEYIFERGSKHSSNECDAYLTISVLMAEII